MHLGLPSAPRARSEGHLLSITACARASNHAASPWLHSPASCQALGRDTSTPCTAPDPHPPSRHLLLPSPVPQLIKTGEPSHKTYHGPLPRCCLLPQVLMIQGFLAVRKHADRITLLVRAAGGAGAALCKLKCSFVID